MVQGTSRQANQDRGKMRFTQQTTSLDLLTEFKESIFQLLDEIEERFEQGKKGGASQEILAVHTRKQILKWFYDNGGL